MSLRYKKYVTLIVLFTLFLTLFMVNNISNVDIIEHYNNIKESMQTKPELRYLNININNDMNSSNTILKCQDKDDEDTEYILYKYENYSVFNPMTNNNNNSEFTNNVINKCMKVKLKNFHNDKNTLFGEEDDGKYALSVNNIDRLNACDFEDGKNPINNSICNSGIETFQTKMNSIDKHFDIVNVLFFILLTFLFIYIIKNIINKNKN